MKNKVLLFFCIFLVFSGKNIFICNSQEMKQITLKEEDICDIKKMDSSFAYIENLFIEGDCVYFTGNIKDIKKTYRMSDINNPKNNYICRYCIEKKEFKKRRFPIISLPRKFRLIYGKQIFL